MGPLADWLALTRDVPFRDYDTDALVAAAVADINAFTEPLTSDAGTKWTPATVFRGETSGDLVGPYLSQFLWLDIPYGIKQSSSATPCPTAIRASSRTTLNGLPASAAAGRGRGSRSMRLLVSSAALASLPSRCIATSAFRPT